MSGHKSIGEKDWKPHNWNVETNPNVETSNSRTPGPDWTSSLRCIQNANEDTTIYCEQNKLLTGRRHFPWKCEQSTNEWKYHSKSGSEYGKRCIIDGDIPGNMQTVDEVVLEKVIGSHARVYDTRGNLPCSSPGDKSYAVPEYSASFHKEGSTLPAVNFSRSHEPVADTFIPLHPLPRKPSTSFKQKEVMREVMREKEEVENLNEWTPAPTITAGIF